jgi:hypothetical protein|tara:strand:+ start:333 stop:974 length:642 start_codon:yes stop_codon:yes gene_type:complete
MTEETQMTWTPQKVGQVKTMLEQGISVEAIAHQLGTTRSAIVGMKYRKLRDMPVRNTRIAKSTCNEQNPVWSAARVRDRFLLKFVVVTTNNSPSVLAQKAGMSKSAFTRVLNNPVIHYNWSRRTLKKLAEVTNPIAYQKITDACDLADYMAAVNKLVEFNPKKHVDPVRVLYDVMASLQGNRWGPIFRLIMEEIVKEKEAPFPPKKGDSKPFR